MQLGLKSTGSVTHCHLKGVGGSPNTDFLSSKNPILFPSDLQFSLSCCSSLMGTVLPGQNKPALPCQLLSQFSSITGEPQSALAAACPLPCSLWGLPSRTHINPLNPAQSTCARAAPAPWLIKPFPAPRAPAPATPALTHIPPCSSGKRLISCSLTASLPWLPENRGLYLYF